MNFVTYNSVGAAIWGMKLSWNVIEQKMLPCPVEHPYVLNEPSEC
jgi:hypothetical protein